jgi:hypothetical protein
MPSEAAEGADYTHIVSPLFLWMLQIFNCIFFNTLLLQSHSRLAGTFYFLLCNDTIHFSLRAMFLLVPGLDLAQAVVPVLLSLLQPDFSFYVWCHIDAKQVKEPTEVAANTK